jgi:hypothetical protein
MYQIKLPTICSKLNRISNIEESQIPEFISISVLFLLIFIIIGILLFIRHKRLQQKTEKSKV